MDINMEKIGLKLCLKSFVVVVDKIHFEAQLIADDIMFDCML